MMRYKILLSVLTCVLTVLSAQAQTIVHDKQKEKQWRSMEDGPWDFAPDWYYYFLHNDYSGADKHWQWHGLESGFEIRFKEEDSNVKRIMPSRILSEETQRQKEKKVEEEMNLLKELHDEEVARSVDRNVDLVYDTFKEDFERMQDAISEGLLFCQHKSKGKLNYQIEQLSRQNGIICENIAYLHKQGVGFELENAKRRKGYADAKREMEQLVNRVAHLVGIAMQYRIDEK